MGALNKVYNVQYLINSDLRTINIPENGYVAGVEGDKDVNVANFKISRWYNELDLSEFDIRINYVNANGHDVIEHAGLQATCTTSGYYAYETCSKCNYSTYQEISKLNHSIYVSDELAATCGADGYKVYSCNREGCNHTYTVVESALVHN